MTPPVKQTAEAPKGLNDPIPKGMVVAVVEPYNLKDSKIWPCKLKDFNAPTTHPRTDYPHGLAPASWFISKKESSNV